MEKKIPSKDLVIEAIKKVMEARKYVESKEELADFVEKYLKSKDPNYRVSGNRVKKLSLKLKEVKVKANVKRIKTIESICPVCKSSNIQKLKSKNLANNEIIIGYKCLDCNFTSSKQNFGISKYVFIWKEG